MVEKVLGNTGAPIKTWTIMYKVVVQAGLMYGSKIWVVIDAMMTVIEGFHHRTAICIVIMPVRKGGRDELNRALVDAVLEVIGIWKRRD